jgi:predicted XRE-type DNA-binding protein
MKNSKTKNYVVAKNTIELANILGLDSADAALMEYKALLSEFAAKSIIRSGLTVNEIVERSGVARSKVSAVKNGCVAGISCDLFFKVISATGAKLTLKMAS